MEEKLYRKDNQCWYDSLKKARNNLGLTWVARHQYRKGKGQAGIRLGIFTALIKPQTKGKKSTKQRSGMPSTAMIVNLPSRGLLNFYLEDLGPEHTESEG